MTHAVSPEGQPETVLGFGYDAAWSGYVHAGTAMHARTPFYPVTTERA